jgi:hypothetical protein
MWISWLAVTTLSRPGQGHITPLGYDTMAKMAEAKA